MIDIEVTGAGAVIKNFDEIQKRAGNLSSAFTQISQMMLKSHETNFRQKGARFGARWPARKFVYPWGILDKTGKLSRGFKASSSKDTAEVTNTVSYAKYHQTGTNRLPIRGIIGLAGDGGKTDINDAVRILRKQLNLEGA